jgi:hypothetical protein
MALLNPKRSSTIEGNIRYRKNKAFVTISFTPCRQVMDLEEAQDIFLIPDWCIFTSMDEAIWFLDLQNTSALRQI